MLLICKNNWIKAGADLIGGKRFIYDEGNPEGKKVEAQQGKEKKEVTAEDVDKAKENFRVEKAALEKKLDEYAKSENPAIQKAVEQARADLKRFGESSVITPEAIQNQLNYIKQALYYFEWKPKLESNVKKIEKKTEEAKKKWTEAIAAMADQYIKDNPNLPKENSDAIRAMVADYAERMDGAVTVAQIVSTQDSDISLQDYLLDPGRLNAAFEANKKGYEYITGSGNPSLYNTLNDLYEEMEQRSEAQICIGYSKEQKNSEEYIQNYSVQTKSLLVEWGKEQKQDVTAQMAQLDTIFSSALAAVKVLTKPGDAPQRALVMANMQDQIDLLYTGKRKEKDPQALTDQTTLVEQTMKQMKVSPDKYFTGFEKGKSQPADPNLKLDEKVKDKALAFGTVGSPNFRLEGSGARIMTLPPNTVLQILDTNVMSVETSDGKKVNYLKVRMNPPDGPVGYVSQNHINFQKQIVDLDSQNPESKKQPNA